MSHKTLSNIKRTKCRHLIVVGSACNTDLNVGWRNTCWCNPALSKYEHRMSSVYL